MALRPFLVWNPRRLTNSINQWFDLYRGTRPQFLSDVNPYMPKYLSIANQVVESGVVSAASQASHRSSNLETAHSTKAQIPTTISDHICIVYSFTSFSKTCQGCQDKYLLHRCQSVQEQRMLLPSSTVGTVQRVPFFSQHRPRSFLLLNPVALTAN